VAVAAAAAVVAAAAAAVGIAGNLKPRRPRERATAQRGEDPWLVIRAS
jgi:hypothetical protein